MNLQNISFININAANHVFLAKFEKILFFIST